MWEPCSFEINFLRNTRRLMGLLDRSHHVVTPSLVCSGHRRKVIRTRENIGTNNNWVSWVVRKLIYHLFCTESTIPGVVVLVVKNIYRFSSCPWARERRYGCSPDLKRRSLYQRLLWLDFRTPLTYKRFKWHKLFGVWWTLDLTKVNLRPSVRRRCVYFTYTSSK